MKATDHTTTTRRQAATRRVGDPFPLPLENYRLSLSSLLELTGQEKNRNERRYDPPVRFQSFRDGRLTLTVKDETGSLHTLTLDLEETHLSLTCSCGGGGKTLCEPAYRYLFNAARRGDSFQPFRPGGVVETALAHPSRFAIRYAGTHGIGAEPKREGGTVYALDTFPLSSPAPCLQLPGGEPQPQQTERGYILMVSRRGEEAPFILPCRGKLSKDGKDIKTFSHYLSPGAKHATGIGGIGGEDPSRLSACAEIGRRAEGLPGTGGIGSTTPIGSEKSEHLAELFRLFQRYLPRFRESYFYLWTYRGTRYRKSPPVRSWLCRAEISGSRVGMRFHLHGTEGGYTLTQELLIDGKKREDYELIASFFLARLDWREVCLFASLRDAAVTQWMNEQRGKITIFPAHYDAFERDILRHLAAHYEIRKTGGAKGK